MEVRDITVFVQPVVGAPAIHRFTVTLADQVALGQCVTQNWRVEGRITTPPLSATMLLSGTVPRFTDRPPIALHRLALPRIASKLLDYKYDKPVANNQRGSPGAADSHATA
ncbi:MAG: hypothetical protein IPH82_10590 [Chloroflexi bacterium]|nr:hypothetical protein [Chloroflexota bacterium]